ncbi:MAG: exodeoxyribonuclease VII large subunit [Tannerellaceae bacterium]|jgi:exodeoxyribonuclease VII large subunit|nr:exodeoxyribonuclease VII large subunit [Tannerellaceae bacterium]
MKTPMKTPADKQRACTLSELGNRLKGVVRHAFADSCWVRAEMSDVRIHASGHCYLEFVEKHPVSGLLTAKMRACIWAKTFRHLKPSFEEATAQPFASGLKVLAEVSVDYHEVYGFSLNVLDMDPSYTVGDMLRKRMEIILRLKAEGIFTLNRELPFPDLPRRIAVITSPTAAGYEDFVHQLRENPSGYVFYLKLFPAIMQGERTEASVIAALERIFACLDCFDLVVIIRGGGASSELSSFDSYLLAAHCAQFPLPLVTGIGHERDDTILDLVAHRRMKTPTAVAGWLIQRMDEAAARLGHLQQSLSAAASGRLNRHGNLLLALQTSLGRNTQTLLTAKSHSLTLTEQFLSMASPEYILKRGYSLTLKDGKIIKRTTSLAPGEEITTRFADGEVQSRVL